MPVTRNPQVKYRMTDDTMIYTRSHSTGLRKTDTSRSS